jgi:hypothetical protein
LQFLGRLSHALPKAFILFCLAGALVFAGWVSVRELAADRLEAVAQDIALHRSSRVDDPRIARWLQFCGADCPSRSYEAAAAADVALAFNAHGPVRDALLAQAERTTRQGLRRTPVSSEAWARLALILSERAGGAATPAVQQALQTSYDAAPYQKAAAQWRIAFCADHWPQITPALRKAALAEHEWLSRVDWGSAERLRAGIENPFLRDLFELELVRSGLIAPQADTSR